MSLAVVQHTHMFKANSGGGQSGVFSFGSGPMNGNLMIVLAFIGDSAPTAAAGWNVDTATYSGAADSGYFAIYYRYAGASEPTSQTFDSTSRTLFEIVAYEISGVTGTWGTDFVASHCNPALYSNYSGSYSYTTASFNTGQNNEMALGLQAQITGTNNSYVFAATPSPAGATDENADVTGTAGGWFGITLNGNILGTHQSIASSGTSTDVAVVGNGGAAITSSYTGYIFAELKGAAPTTETGNVTMALSKVSFSAAAGREEAAAGGLALNKVGFAATAGRRETAATTLALGGVAISASGVDLGPAGGGTVHFATFGA